MIAIHPSDSRILHFSFVNKFSVSCHAIASDARSVQLPSSSSWSCFPYVTSFSLFLDRAPLQFTEGRSFIKNNKVSTIPLRPRSYSLSFSFKPTKFVSAYRSIVHLTTGRNTGWGGRIPAVYSYSNKLYICGAVGGSSNYCSWSQAIALNRWAKVQIVNSKIGPYYYFRIYVNGRQIRRVRNTNRRVYRNVKVYLSDPWSAPAEGNIRNLKVNLRKYNLFLRILGSKH